MTVHRRLAAILLLLAAVAMPQWLGLAAHELEHHEHAGDAAAEWSGLAKALVHGHEHAEGIPDHEHHLLPSSPARQDSPRDLQAPVLATLEALESGHALLSGVRPRGPVGLSGPSPPRLHLLCTLLI